MTPSIFEQASSNLVCSSGSIGTPALSESSLKSLRMDYRKLSITLRILTTNLQHHSQLIKLGNHVICWYIFLPLCCVKELSQGEANGIPSGVSMWREYPKRARKPPFLFYATH